jgi:hypothetical protein
VITKENTHGRSYAFSLVIPDEWVMLDSIDYATNSLAYAYVKYRLVENKAKHFDEDAKYAVFTGKGFSGSYPANIQFDESAAHMVARMHDLLTYLPLKKNYISEALGLVEELDFDDRDFLIVKGKVTTMYLRDETLKTILYLKEPTYFYGPADQPMVNP